MFDWYITIIGIGLIIGGFLFGGIWLRVSGEVEFNLFMKILIGFFTIVAILVGLYCALIGLGF